MESSRRQHAAEQAGFDLESQAAEKMEIQKAVEKEQVRRDKKAERRAELEDSLTFQCMSTVKRWFDDYYLDAIIGFIPGGVGDFVSSILVLPFIHFSLFKVRSIPLTLAVLNNAVKDMILGLIPFYIGNVIDFFYKSNKKNLELCMGFINDDKETISEVNRKAVGAAIVLAILCVILYYMVRLVIYAGEWISGLFS